MEMNERMKKVRQHFGFTQKEFAETLGVTLPSVQAWEYGRSNPSGGLQFKMTQLLGVNPLFLNGTSDIIEIPPDNDTELVDRVLEGNDPLIKALLIGIVKNPDGWQMLAKSIMTAADYLHKAGFEHEKNSDSMEE